MKVCILQVFLRAQFLSIQREVIKNAAEEPPSNTVAKRKEGLGRLSWTNERHNTTLSKNVMSNPRVMATGNEIQAS